MKRLLVILLGALLLTACGNKDESDNEQAEQSDPEGQEELVVDGSKNTPIIAERLEELLSQDELTEDDEKELYLIALNSMLNKYDEEYETFDMEAGTNLYKSIKPTANQDVEVANGMKESLVELMDEEQQKVYGSFLDDLMELEETFAHLNWSD